MKTKKRLKIDLKGFLNKKENMAILAVAAVFCAGLIVTEMKAGDIPLHDGDVLVDSRNIAQAEETTDEETGDGSAEAAEDSETQDEDQSAAQDGSQGETAAEGAQSEKSGGTFAEKRAKLELQRTDLIAGYDDTIKNSTNDAEKRNAVANKEKLTKYMEQEVSIENIIASKNLPECLVIITESTVTVTVDEQDLTQNTVAKICNIVMEETQRTADKIIIQSNY